MKAYNGKPITYDAIGNPTNDFTWRYTWQHGRQLASMIRIGQPETWNFTYNADGLRTQKTNGTRTYQYTYLGDQLSQMTVDGHTLYFTYDTNGSPISLTYDGTNYYYVTNLQGDILALLDTTGTEVVRYTYDAWGNILTTTGSLATTVGYYNPLRYRAYVYDTETQLYYLQSRYYNPDIGRFINADGLTSTGQGLSGNNMFAYCANAPVSRKDDIGEFWHIVAGAAIGAVVSFASSIAGDLIEGNEIDWAGAGISAAFGAASGALAATGLGTVAQVAGGAILAGAENAIEQGRESGFDKINYKVVVIEAAIGGISSRSNGISKSTKNHLYKQQVMVTKRVSNSVKNQGLKSAGKAVRAAGKYYFSQTKTLFYKPLFQSGIKDFLSSFRKSIFKSIIQQIR